MKLSIKACDAENQIGNTHLQGHVDLPFMEMASVFGNPTCYGDAGDKVDVEWNITFYDENNVCVGFCTVYNWKNGVNYNGIIGIPFEEMTHWNVGGHSKERSIDLLNKYFFQLTEPLVTA